MGDILNFGKKRTAKEAVIFYFVYLVAIMIAGAIGGFIAAVITGAEENASEVGFRGGAVMAVILAAVLGWLILKEKRLTKDLPSVVTVVIAIFLSMFAGGIGAMLPLAYLTTKDAAGSKPQSDPMDSPPAPPTETPPEAPTDNPQN